MTGFFLQVIRFSPVSIIPPWLTIPMYLLGQGWANYGPLAKYGPLRGSMRPAEGLENAKENEVSKKHL
jgi:hypothetical protein